MTGWLLSLNLLVWGLGAGEVLLYLHIRKLRREVEQLKAGRKQWPGTSNPGRRLP